MPATLQPTHTFRPTASALWSCRTITPPLSRLSLDTHMPWHMHTCTSTTCNATCLQSRDHSSGVFCSPSLLSDICSCYPQLPTPRPVTPEPNLEPASDNFAHSCPPCHTGNTYSWWCPLLIPDPTIDQENVFDLNDGTLIGHAFCVNCDQLHNIQAPTLTKCDFCQVLFCGVGIQGCCCAIGLLSQQPHGMVDFSDLILSRTLYDCFQRNPVKVNKTRYSNCWHLVTRDTGEHTFRLSHDKQDLLVGHI